MRAHIFFFSCFCFLFWWQNIFIKHVPSSQYWNLLRFYKKKGPKEYQSRFMRSLLCTPLVIANIVHPKPCRREFCSMRPPPATFFLILLIPKLAQRYD